MENSHILSFRGKEATFKEVVAKINKAELPIKMEYNGAAMCFYYEMKKPVLGQSPTIVVKCDGNTAHHLENIIKGLIGLYKTE